MTKVVGRFGTRKGEGCGFSALSFGFGWALQDGRTFFFQTAEGPPKKDEVAHTRITFR